MKEIKIITKNLLLVFMLAVAGDVHAAISFVGSCENSAISGSDVTLTLPSTDAGDLVIVSYGIGDADNVDFDMDVTSPTGTFTEVADLFANDALDANLGVYWDITDDSYSQVTVDGLGGTDSSTAAVCMVFRGVDATTPMDVAATTVTGINTMHPNPPSINHNNPSGVWTVIAGASGHSLNTAAGTYTFPTGYTTDNVEDGEIDTSDITVGMGYRSSGVSDPEDPGVMTHSGSDSANYAWGAATLALRPQAATAPTVTTSAETNVDELSATLNGNISSIGGDTVTARGFAWGTDSSLSTVIATSSETGSFSTGTFSENLGGLISGTTYYYRAYATNANGTGYGSIENLVAGTDSTLSRAMRLFEGFAIKLFSGRLIVYGSGAAEGAGGEEEQVTASYRNSYSSTSDLTTYTFSSSDIGTASSDRIVVVGVYTSGSTANTSISSATIAGINATVAVDVPQPSDNQETAMIYAAVPSGTTGDIEITFSGAKGRAVISVWSVYGASAAHSDQDGTAAVTTTSVDITGLTVPANGMGFFMVGHNNIATTGFDWTNATERADTTFENNSRYSAADTSTVGTNTITAAVNTAVDGANLAGVAFGP